MEKIYILVVTILNDDNEIESVGVSPHRSLTLAKAKLAEDYFAKIEDIKGGKDNDPIYDCLEVNVLRDLEYEIGIPGLFYVKGQIIESSL